MKIIEHIGELKADPRNAECADAVQKCTEFRWFGKRERAALLVAQDELTDESISQQVGVTRQALANWKRHPEFRARVKSIVAELRAAILNQGIAVKENRVKALHDRWKRMEKVILERAEDDELRDVAGGTTGLIVHNVKGVGKGADFQLIDLYEVDTGLLREMREHEKQAAIELGQWTESHELTGPGGEAVTIRVVYDGSDDKKRIDSPSSAPALAPGSVHIVERSTEDHSGGPS